MAVAEWFTSFCSALLISSDKRSSLAARTKRITSRLNTDFRSLSSDTANSFYVGSYGRYTATPSVSDVDLLYIVPVSVYSQYDAYSGNKQSALLTAVRQSLMKTYTVSEVFGDGQVVCIKFDDGVTYEILPAFLNVSDGYTFPDTNGGGSWKACKPKQEMNAFATRNAQCNGNLIQLCRMVRVWRDFNNVPMNGMLIDTLAYQFIDNWAYKDKSYLYYDFMSRDFFNFLANQLSTQTYWLAPGSGSYVLKKGSFEYKARQAELRIIEAIAFQSGNYEWSAKQKYREVYGSKFPA